MKVQVFSTFDLTGGAGKAAFRLSQGVRALGVDLRMEVQSRSSDVPWVADSLGGWRKLANRLRPTIDKLPLRLCSSYQGTSWSNNLVPRRFDVTVGHGTAQLVHLHWVGFGFVPISSLPKWSSPIVWTMHDSWAFTGGCHVPGVCRRYLNDCGHCPQLGSKSSLDLSRVVWHRKAANWRDSDLTLVAPSRWMADAARQSHLLRDREICVIPNGLDLKLFRPIDQSLCRMLLNLPLDKKFIAFGGMSPFGDPNKGFSYLSQAIEKISCEEGAENFELLIFGENTLQGWQFALPTHYLGSIRDEFTMAVLLNAADVTMVPSRSENLSNTIMESLACGTPVVCFDIGGNSDMVDHRENGYLARPYDANELADGIRWIVNDADTLPRLRQNARLKCKKEFSLEDVASRYVALYEALLERRWQAKN